MLSLVTLTHSGRCPARAWTPVLDLFENPPPTLPSVPRLELVLETPRETFLTEIFLHDHLAANITARPLAHRPPRRKS